MGYRPSYKQTCIVCRKNKVLISSFRQKPICAECGMREFAPVSEEPYKSLFDIPQELYEKSSFLRSIRQGYHRYGSLTEKQISVFKDVAERIQSGEEGGKQPPAKNPATEVEKEAAPEQERAGKDPTQSPQDRPSRTRTARRASGSRAPSSRSRASRSR